MISIKGAIRTVISNASALLAASYLIDGFSIEPNAQTILTGAIVLSLVNIILKPILKIITFPINAVTLGFFGIIINAVLLYVTAYFVSGIQITGGLFSINALGITIPEIYLSWVPNLILSSFVISVVNWILRKVIF
ncbi:hypothetical protein A2982_02180 [candidate division WWE3 bacterium RIFCSPLOWO2_01_FULL_39_13]|uniref:Phage holin family protein n=1 Tax=candidate division WWE3 bacterium RIFCSPLOWO2_01_FULL_39_13 TaxID=1802624 RepID=A0A1F4V3X0_UNCKA|nr:MAG: hypothetical protein A2982_02180 [candidate division WWE3 bacterium RIFCSPLOWO2_01_FULL_39_13]